MAITIKSSGIEDLQMQLAMLVMPGKKRKRLMWRIGNEVKKKSKANARAQQAADGTKWVQKKRKKGKKKMLTEVPKSIAVSSTPHNATIYFKGKNNKKGNNKKRKYPSGVIAKMHSEGRKIPINRDSYKRTMDSIQAKKGITKKSKATVKQAAYIVKMKGMRYLSREEQKSKGTKPGKQIRMTKSWIQENIKFKQAQAIIIGLQDKAKSSGSWTINLPKRDFLGATAQEQTKIFKRVMQGINYGWTVKKQDIRG